MLTVLAILILFVISWWSFSEIFPGWNFRFTESFSQSIVGRLHILTCFILCTVLLTFLCVSLSSISYKLISFSISHTHQAADTGNPPQIKIWSFTFLLFSFSPDPTLTYTAGQYCCFRYVNLHNSCRETRPCTPWMIQATASSHLCSSAPFENAVGIHFHQTSVAISTSKVCTTSPSQSSTDLLHPNTCLFACDILACSNSARLITFSFTSSHYKVIIHFGKRDRVEPL